MRPRLTRGQFSLLRHLAYVQNKFVRGFGSADMRDVVPIDAHSPTASKLIACGYAEVAITFVGGSGLRLTATGARRAREIGRVL